MATSIALKGQECVSLAIIATDLCNRPGLVLYDRTSRMMAFRDLECELAESGRMRLEDADRMLAACRRGLATVQIEARFERIVYGLDRVTITGFGKTRTELIGWLSESSWPAMEALWERVANRIHRHRA